MFFKLCDYLYPYIISFINSGLYRCFGLINSLLGAGGGAVPSITGNRSSLWSQLLDATWTLPPELGQLKTYPDLDTCPLLPWSRATLSEKGFSVPHSLPYRNQLLTVLQENSHQRAMPFAWIKSEFFVLRNHLSKVSRSFRDTNLNKPCTYWLNPTNTAKTAISH